MVTPPREPGSVRRTSTVDIVRHDGDALGSARARDLVTTSDGEAVTVAGAEVTWRVDESTRVIREMSVAPELAGSESLVGLTLGARFRADAHDLLAHGPWEGHPLVLLLDDLPAARFVSAYAVGRSGGTIPQRQPDRLAVLIDICAGWARDGSAHRALATGGEPLIPHGPDAEPLVRSDDPDAWHDLRLLPPGSMRRTRRLDVVPTGAHTCRVDVYFRDGHIEDDGRETALHEYGLVAEVDGDVVSAVTATPGALPHMECPTAAGSAHQVVGRRLAELRRWVLAEMTGTSTCTHLNDVLRSLADVDALRGHVAR